MRSSSAILATALFLAACGPKALELPAEAVDRAATCGIVAAAEARLAVPGVKDALPFEAQGRIMHFALLAGVEEGGFSMERAGLASKRMSELQASVTGGKWQDLAPACRAAFPEVATPEPALPPSRGEALLACDELARFMMVALEGQKREYGNELGAYRDLRQALERPLGPGLRARAGSGLEAQQRERRRVLAAAAKRGSPVLLLRQCVDRFG